MAWRPLTLTLGLPMTDIERKQRIAYAIRSAREERGLTRPELAALVGAEVFRSYKANRPGEEEYARDVVVMQQHGYAPATTSGGGKLLVTFRRD